MNFTLEKTDSKSKARAGLLETAHGEIETPIFMPVGTAGTVKAVHQHEIKDDIKAQIILADFAVGELVAHVAAGQVSRVAGRVAGLGSAQDAKHAQLVVE